MQDKYTVVVISTDSIHAGNVRLTVPELSRKYNCHWCLDK